MDYAGHLMDIMPSTAIRGKTPSDIWTGGAAQDYDLLRIFGYSAYFSVKDDKLKP